MESMQQFISDNEAPTRVCADNKRAKGNTESFFLVQVMQTKPVKEQHKVLPKLFSLELFVPDNEWRPMQVQWLEAAALFAGNTIKFKTLITKLPAFSKYCRIYMPKKAVKFSFAKSIDRLRTLLNKPRLLLVQTHAKL